MHMLKDTGLIFQLPKILCLNPWDWVTHISKHPITWGTSKTQICLPAAIHGGWGSGRGTGQLAQLGHKCIMRKYMVPASVWVSGCHPEARDPRAPFMGKRG